MDNTLVRTDAIASPHRTDQPYSSNAPGIPALASHPIPLYTTTLVKTSASRCPDSSAAPFESDER